MLQVAHERFNANPHEDFDVVADLLHFASLFGCPLTSFLEILYIAVVLRTRLFDRIAASTSVLSASSRTCT